MDINNNGPTVVRNQMPVDFEQITPENVEAELERLKIIEDTYVSDEEIVKDKVRLTGKGIDFKALKAGQDVCFEFDDNEPDKYNWEDEEDNKIDYKQLFKLRRTEMVVGEHEEDADGERDEDNDDANMKKSKSDSCKMPFEILREKMFDISPYKDNSVLKRVLMPGSGIVVPKGSRVRLHYNAYFELNDEPFDSTYLRNKSFDFKLGYNQVVIGLDIAVASMKKGEKSQFIFEPDYFCGKFGCEPRVPKETPVLFEVEVINFIEANSYEEYENSSEEHRKSITLNQMLMICNCLRQLGNDNYKRMDYREASKKYRKSIYLLDNVSVKNDEEEVRWKSVMLKLYLNMSQVCLKQTKPKKAIYYCKLVLDLEENNVKALYRYGQSLRLLQDFDRSRKFLLKAYNLAPTDKSITEEIGKLDDALAKYKILEKNIYKRMFASNESTKSDGSKSTMSNKYDPNQDDLKSTDRSSLSKSKQFIIGKLNEFAANSQSRMFRIQMNMYSLDIINFIIAQAEQMKFTVRNIKGDTEILQIIKNSE